MGKGNRGNHSRMTWEDAYLDGYIDPEYEIFDEETQRVSRKSKKRKSINDDGWDSYEEHEKYIEDECDFD